MQTHKTLFLTQRSPRHQKAALEAAPEELDIDIRREASKEEIIEAIADKEFLITERSGKIDRDIIEAGKELKLIQRLGSQTYDIDIEAAKEAGIPVCYWPVKSCIMVAEHMVMQMLLVAKRFREVMDVVVEAGDWGESQKCDENYFAYNWSGREDIHGIWNSTVGILGFGEIGTELARRLKNFGCRVMYNKRNPLPLRAEQELNIEYAKFDTLVSTSDYVCMLLPFYPETEKMLNKDFFEKMKPGAKLVSAGAGGVIDEEALKEAIESGHLYGAATDTFSWEPVREDNPLLELASDKRANIMLTPHTAAGTVAAQRDERYGDYENLLRVAKGEMMLYRIV
jgi:phosphoglycerate dehydrogenase-like enzyme